MNDSQLGTFTLSSATGNKPRIKIAGIHATPEDNIWVEVLVTGGTGLAGGGADPFPLTLQGPNAGLFSKGVIIVQGTAGGDQVDITIRAWKKDRGATFDDTEEAFRASQTLFGFVLGGGVDSAGIPKLPNSIVTAFAGLEISGVSIR